MNLKRLTQLVPALLIAAFAQIGTAQATALPGITVSPNPELQVSNADISNFFGFNVFGSVSSNTATTPVTSSLMLIINADILPDGTIITGSMSMADGGAAWLNGSLSALAFTNNASGDDTIELLFNGHTGAAAAEFGGLSVVTLTGEFGATPFDPTAPLALSGVFGSARLNPATSSAVIPLPATGLILIGGLGALGVAARRRKTT